MRQESTGGVLLEVCERPMPNELDGELLADQRICTPQPGRRVLVRLADTKVAFIKPDDPNNGPLGNFLTPPSSGVYALVWRVEDEAMAESFFQKNGLRCAPSSP